MQWLSEAKRTKCLSRTQEKERKLLEYLNIFVTPLVLVCAITLIVFCSKRNERGQNPFYYWGVSCTLQPLFLLCWCRVPGQGQCDQSEQWLLSDHGRCRGWSLQPHQWKHGPVVQPTTGLQLVRSLPFTTADKISVIIIIQELYFRHSWNEETL